MTAVINDTQYSNKGINPEPTQTIASAECYVDMPPWEEWNKPVGMKPADGNFYNSIEPVVAKLSTADLAPGRHSLFIRGKDMGGNWGAVSAVFFTIQQSIFIRYLSFF